jgi:hypothetical protein
MNWALIHRYLNDCLPQPDGSNLSSQPLGGPGGPTALSLYWTDAARRSWIDLAEKQRQGIQDDISLNDLIQINIQGVYARYCTPAMTTAFSKIIPKRTNVVESIVSSEWDRPPQKADGQPKKGWAVEVRGYTYHKDGFRFVLNTYLDNLRTRKGVWAPLNDPNPKWTKLDVSHVAMLVYDATIIKPGGNSPGFKYINQGLFLNELLAGSTSGPAAPGGQGSMSGSAGPGSMGLGGGDQTGAGPGAPAAGGGGTSRGAWSGLGSALGSSGSSGLGDGGMGKPGGGAPGAPGAPQLPSAPGFGSGSGTNQGPAVGDARAPLTGERKRTEFVIVLFWAEYLPTEPVSANEDANAAFSEGGQPSDGMGGYGPGGGQPPPGMVGGQQRPS